MQNYRTVYLVNPSKRHYEGMLDSVVYKIPAKGFLPVVHFLADHLMKANEKLEKYESIIEVINRIKGLGTYEVYFQARANAEDKPEETLEEKDSEE
jgi:hypothetical protein